MNHMIDGDNGRECASPYHDSRSCPNCNGENEERRTCDFCDTKERWSLTEQMPDGLIRCEACKKKNAHLCIEEGCGNIVYGRDEMCEFCHDEKLEAVQREGRPA